VSFIKRAREAAEAAAEQAQHAAGLATHAAADPATQEKLSQQARQAMGAARRGITTVVERIDPGVLADLIIKATALQELTNSSLREKKSPYRISEVAITASIPPGISFSIGRLDVPEEALTGREVSSAQLAEELPESGEAVISLDGTTLSQEQISEVREALGNDIPEDINQL
jgi:hypothetical protein